MNLQLIGVNHKTAPVENPVGPEAGTRRSIRSSGFKSNQDQAVAAVRFFDNPKTHSRDRGFRCVVFGHTHSSSPTLPTTEG